MSIDSVLLIIRNTQKHFIHPLVRLGINKSRDIKSMHYTGVKMNELQYVPKCYHLYRKKKTDNVVHYLSMCKYMVQTHT